MAGLPVLQVCFVLGIIFHCTFLGLIFKWRKNFPLSKRQPHMIMFQVFLLGIFGSFVLVYPGFYAPEVISCLAYNISINSLFYAVFLSVLLRVVYLWNLDFQTYLVNKFHSFPSNLDYREDSCSDRLQFWYFKNRKLLGLRLFYLIAFLEELELLLNSYSFFKASGADQFYRGSSECRRIYQAGSSRNLYFLRLLIAAGLLFFLLFNLRKLKDNFGLLSEVKVMIGVMFSMIIYFLIASQVQSMLVSQAHFVLFGFVLEVAWMFLVVFPVVRWSRNWSQKHSVDLKVSTDSVKSKPRVRNIQENLQLLDRVLNHPTGYELLYRFLQNEFALENILFWKASQDFVTEFNQSAFETSNKPIENAQELMVKYVNNDAIMCINISFACRQDLFKEFQTLLMNADNLQEKVKTFANALLAAQKEVLKMTAMDSFVRFRETPHFKEFAINDQVTNQQELILRPETSIP
jgi:hypothetical protein